MRRAVWHNYFTDPKMRRKFYPMRFFGLLAFAMFCVPPKHGLAIPPDPVGSTEIHLQSSFFGERVRITVVRHGRSSVVFDERVANTTPTGLAKALSVDIENDDRIKVTVMRSKQIVAQRIVKVGQPKKNCLINFERGELFFDWTDKQLFYE